LLKKKEGGGGRGGGGGGVLTVLHKGDMGTLVNEER